MTTDECYALISTIACYKGAKHFIHCGGSPRQKTRKQNLEKKCSALMWLDKRKVPGSFRTNERFSKKTKC